jgi:hypothetical protein
LPPASPRASDARHLVRLLPPARSCPLALYMGRFRHVKPVKLARTKNISVCAYGLGLDWVEPA